MEIKIIENMPAPKRKSRKPSQYPFDKLEVGAGFKVGFDTTDTAVIDKLIQRIRVEANNYRKDNKDFHYESVQVGEDDKIEPVGAGLCVRRVAGPPKVTITKIEADKPVEAKGLAH